VNLTLNFLKKRKRRAGPSLNDPDAALHQDPALIDTTREADPERQSSLRNSRLN